MPSLSEDSLSFDFPEGWRVEKYDAWEFYKSRFQSCAGGSKGVDFIAWEEEFKTLWLIEVKDYRHFTREKTTTIWNETAVKARDTLAGIFAASVNYHGEEQAFAKRVLKAEKIRLVLHLEQPRQTSRLYPRIFDRADVQQKLKSLAGSIDPQPAVVEMARLGRVFWQVRET